MRPVADVNKEAKKALEKQFEPESHKDNYIAKLQTKRRRQGENLATFGEKLKLTAEQAYPDLGEKAREQIALTQHLSSISNRQLAFSVRQKRPTSVEEAVTTTMEMDSYMALHLAMVGTTRSSNDRDDSEIAAVTSRRKKGNARPTAEVYREALIQVRRWLEQQ